MKKLITKRTIVVEGRYDAVKLNSITDASIITTDGFAIYSDKEKKTLLKRLAKKDGLVLLLDADAAGFQMRHYITDLVGSENVLQVYTPAVKGKERRKETAGKEGLLGVEGIETAQLHQLLSVALAKDTQKNLQAVKATSTEPQIACDKTTKDQDDASIQQVNYTDLYRWGLSGCEGSSARKTVFLQSLGLPPRLSKKELVQVLNKLYTYQELDEKQKAMFG